MKKTMKRVLALCMAGAMMFSIAACGKGESTNKNGNKTVEAVTFPLEEEVTFTFMVAGSEDYDFKEKIGNNHLWNKLKEDTNVNIEFQFLGESYSEQVSLLASSGKYGDVIWGGNVLSSQEASKYIASEIFIDITDYINEDIMPNFCADLKERPAIKQMVTAADGGIYTLPRITGLEGYYLESPIWINKAWLNKLGLGIPTTLDEFTNVLRAFKEKDPNGNGLPDEIPYICCTAASGGFMHTEALLGMWGIATKDGTNDAFVQVVDGKVTFAPAQEAYKEAVTYLNQLYKEELMWGQAFTANLTTMNAKLTNATPLVGCFTAKEPAATAYANDYVCIAPPKVNGYEPCWYMHSGINGSKNQFYVTDKCENVNVLMAWMDQFYDLDIAIETTYGEVGSGRVNLNADGKYEFADLDAATSTKLDKDSPTIESLFGTPIRSITESDYANKITMGKSDLTMQNNLEIYKDIVNTETWPRPYYAAEDAYDADTYTTDIMYVVQTNRAEWITGRSDINQTWDAYIKKLDTLGLDKLLEIMQKAYDASMGN